jgi:hypothetical protein
MGQSQPWAFSPNSHHPSAAIGHAKNPLIRERLQNRLRWRLLHLHERKFPLAAGRS